jgi:hypothetical protein
VLVGSASGRRSVDLREQLVERFVRGNTTQEGQGEAHGQEDWDDHTKIHQLLESLSPFAKHCAHVVDPPLGEGGIDVEEIAFQFFCKLLECGEQVSSNERIKEDQGDVSINHLAPFAPRFISDCHFMGPPWTSIVTPGAPAIFEFRILLRGLSLV